MLVCLHEKWDAHTFSKRELKEEKERELEEEKERLLNMYRQDFESYQKRATELQDHLRDLLTERNNLAKDFMVRLSRQETTKQSQENYEKLIS